MIDRWVIAVLPILDDGLFNQTAQLKNLRHFVERTSPWGHAGQHQGRILMIQNRLRLYCGPDSDLTTTAVADVKKAPDTVKVSAGEIFAWLADAAASDRTWLKDFEADEVTISSDLYEVILAYQHFRRPSA